MKTKLIMIISIVGVLITLTSYAIYTYIDSKDEISNQNFDKVVQKTSRGNYELKTKEVTQPGDVVLEMKVRDVKEVYKDIHLMANSVIIAGEVWGKETITEEKVNALLLEVMTSQYTDKEQLIEILTRWKNGDFVNIKNDHNYVWNMLGGTVGEAYDVDWSKLPSWTTNKGKE